MISNSSWLLFDKICRLGLSLLVGAWVARYLGPNEYGELAYVLAYVAFFQAVVILGLDNIVVRDISKNPFFSGEIIGTTLILRMISGFILWFIAVINIGVINGFDSNITLITALCGGSLVFQAADVIDLWFQSQSKSKRTVIVKLSSYLISNGIKVYLILNQATLVYFAMMFTIEGLLSALGLSYAYKKYPIKNISISISRAKDLLSESWPFIISSLSIIIYMRIDQILIKEFLGNKELGIYAAILPLATLWTFIPLTISTSLAPILARKKEKNELDYWNTLKNIFRLYALLGWSVCFLVILVSPYVVPLLFGKDFIIGVKIIPILVLTNLFINLGLAQTLWILNEGKSKISLYKTIIGVFVCLISNFILIPMFGLYGAAYSAVLSQFASTILSNIFFSKEILRIQVRSLFLLKS